jgi:hypothetical protein
MGQPVEALWKSLDTYAEEKSNVFKRTPAQQKKYLAKARGIVRLKLCELVHASLKVPGPLSLLPILSGKT